MTLDLQIFIDALFSRVFLEGALIAVALAVLSLAGAAVLGFVMALLRDSRIAALRTFAAGYIWFFRAIPTLLQLLFTWNALPQLFPALRENWFSPFLAALIALIINESAYVAEIVRAGLLSIDDGQREAGRAVGLKPGAIIRWILLPQAIRVSLPPMGNELINMLKLTSLASVISLQELLTVTAQQVSLTFAFVELYLAAAVYYLVIVSIFTLIQRRLERNYEWTSRKVSSTPMGAITRAIRLPSLTGGNK
ncbi:amino acid ABC transporter permease [Agrococcus sp. KRD186]|uniref:amino acid ABC transporter permease n=1 Tax=Agrococcus sp. KRD186 TaxID=2729730 RepID=UPI0019D18D2E|nr:amino acid ABC transporter permease [Agrococcus sp. KRD186]